jgi:uncharacterized protein with NRDE domain
MRATSFFTFAKMCLVAIAWKVNPDFPLLVSSNRDEFFNRPTVPLHRWEEGFFAGKDLQAGGTWMGFHPDGKWAILTNYIDFINKRNPKISRGKLVSDFLTAPISPENYLDQIWEKQQEFDGFNLLVSDGDRLFYLSNYGNEPEEIHAGIHGLSNRLLNDPSPKTELAKSQLKSVLTNPNPENLLSILKSEEKYPLELLPKTGLRSLLEVELSSQLIRMPPDYGTLSSTAILRNNQGKTLVRERNFEWDHTNFRDTEIRF